MVSETLVIVNVDVSFVHALKELTIADSVQKIQKRICGEFDKAIKGDICRSYQY